MGLPSNPATGKVNTAANTERLLDYADMPLITCLSRFDTLLNGFAGGFGVHAAVMGVALHACKLHAATT